MVDVVFLCLVAVTDPDRLGGGEIARLAKRQLVKLASQILSRASHNSRIPSLQLNGIFSFMSISLAKLQIR